MKNRSRFTRTKSQCREAPSSQVKDTAYSTYMKFKPFSQECTLDHIQEKLQSFRNTMTYHPTHQRKNSQQTPLAARLKSIIGGKRKSQKRDRRNNFTELDIRSSENSHFSENIEQKYRRLSKLKEQSVSFSKSNLKECEPSTECPQPILPNTTVSHVRHDLSHQAIAEQNAFFDMLHKPKSSILLANFNKNNCFLFSRSKHKVFAVEQERIRRPAEIKESSNKFQSFGTYFYGSYMKKYVERRRLLGKKGTLIKMVAR